MAVGIFNTGALPQDLAKKSFAQMITRIFPNGSTPLYGMTSMLKEESAMQIEHGFFTKTMVFPSLTSTAADAAGATTLNVVSTANIFTGMMFRNETTAEQVVVLTAPTATTVTVKRAIGTVAAAAATINDVWYMSGTAFEEASLRPQAMNIIAVRVTNYTQIFRNSWAVSATNDATQVIAGGSSAQESKNEAASFHSQDMEKALIWGQKYLGTNGASTQPFHTMDGIENLIRSNAPSNIVTLGGSATPTTWTALEAALDQSLDFITDANTGNSRAVFAGGQALRAFHQVFRLNSTYMIQNQTNSYGLRFTNFTTPRGDFNLVQHPLFNALGRNNAWAKASLVMDLANFNLAYLRRTKHLEYNQSGTPVDNGIDAVGGTLTTELTCLHKLPQACMVLKNFTTGANG